MKKRIIALALAVFTISAALCGCDTTDKDPDNGNDDPKELLYEAVNELGIGETLPEGYLADRIRALSEAEGNTLKELFAAREAELTETSDGSNQSKFELEKYTSESVKARLSTAQATLYDRLYALCEKFINNPSHYAAQDGFGYISGTVRYSDLDITIDGAEAVFLWFWLNNPQFYFIEGMAYTESELFVSVGDYAEDKITNELFGKLDDWALKCGSGADARDKLAALNKAICDNLEFSGDDISIYSALTAGKGAGYALVFSAAANAMGINCCTVFSEDHIWNAVEINLDNSDNSDSGKYYFADACWNDQNSKSEPDDRLLGFGTSYADYRDNGTNAHTMTEYCEKFAPEISAEDYDNQDSSGSVSAPVLKISGSGSNIAKVEWDAVSSAEKYEYSVINGGTVYSSGFTADKAAYAVFPEGVLSATVRVRAIGNQNGKTVYSKYSEIIVSKDTASQKPQALKNIGVENSGGIRASWNAESVDGYLLIVHGEDSTLTRVLMSYTLDDNIIGWVEEWAPEKDVYFSLMAIKRTGNTETYSEPVRFKYNIKDGMKLISDSSSSGSSNNSGGDVEIVTRAYSNGVYVGYMSDGKANGQGTFTWNSGDVYEGEWVNDKQNGFGKMTWANGSVYEGEWTNNIMNGEGKLSYSNGDSYDGDWVEGAFVRGVMTQKLSNGTYIYESDEFIDYKMNGPSTLTVKHSNGDKSVLVGTAENGEITGEVVLDYTWYLGSRFHYEGGYNGTKETGDGIKTTYYTNKTYQVEEGVFRSGKLYNGTYTLYNSDGSVQNTRQIVNGG